jgi:hypothetical protein
MDAICLKMKNKKIHRQDAKTQKGSKLKNLSAGYQFRVLVSGR